MEKKFKQHLQEFIDNIKKSTVDKCIYVLMIVSTLIVTFLYISTFKIITSVEINNYSKLIYSGIILNAVFIFYFSMLGERTSKPVNRPKIYLFTTVTIAISTYSLLAEIFNSFFVSAINTLIDMTAVPIFIVQTNSKILTVVVPFIIVAIGFYKSMTIAFKKEYRVDLQEYTVDWLTRNVENIDIYNVDCKICEDFASGEDIYLTEKQSFRHMLIAGNSGSGKTSLVLRPYLAQLFYKKSFFKDELKKLTIEALEEELCYINVPVTNKYFNDNFSMNMITIKDDKRVEFLKKFDKLILGIRASENQIYSDIVENGKVEIPIHTLKGVRKTSIKIEVYIDGVVENEHKVEYISSDFNKAITTKDYSIEITTGVFNRQHNEDLEDDVEESVSETYGITIEANAKGDYKDFYTYRIIIIQHTEGKIIYRDTGVTTVAPDGGLGEQTVKIGEANGIKVHKIDPKMEEIRKGNIATYNPMTLGDPEKTGDIIASILIGMEDGEVNPYYKNAGIRAIRNIVILLKVMYPRKNKVPTLEDVLELLNNFKLVEELTREMAADDVLNKRWKSVIEYFETSFYEMETLEDGKTRKKGSNYGVKRAKTQEALGGTINQLDNFIGREEIRYILCNQDEGLKLDEVLENGESIAIATRQAELGEVIGRAFALFFIMSLQTAVLSRYSEDEAPEIPYEILIDEFPFYLNDQSKVFFTFSRKYKCSVTCVIQNIAQLKEQSDTFREIILTNTNTKLILPGSNVEDRMYYAEMFGFEDVFETKTGISTTPVFSDNARYVETKSGALTEKNRVSKENLAKLEFKNCYYSITDTKGKLKIGKGTLDFIKLDDSTIMKSKVYDFRKYLDRVKKDSIKEYSDVKIDKVVKAEIKEEAINYDELAVLIANNEVELNELQEVENIDVKAEIVEKSYEDSEKVEKVNSTSELKTDDNVEVKKEIKVEKINYNEMSDIFNTSGIGDDELFAEMEETKIINDIPQGNYQVESETLNANKEVESIQANKLSSKDLEQQASDEVNRSSLREDEKLREWLNGIYNKFLAAGKPTKSLIHMKVLLETSATLKRIAIPREIAKYIHLNKNNYNIAIVATKSSKAYVIFKLDDEKIIKGLLSDYKTITLQEKYKEGNVDGFKIISK